MKKIVRLTESDLMRIVKRVIREQEWSDEDESELSSAESKYKDIQSRMMDKSKSIHSKYPPSNDNELYR